MTWPGAGSLALLGVLVLVAALVAGEGPEGTSSVQDPETPQPPATQADPDAAGALSVRDFGAGADDGEDDQAAFEEAVSRARAEDRSVSVPPGTYELSDVLVLDGVALRGAGRDDTRLVSADASAATIMLTGEQPRLEHLEHAVPGAEQRSPATGRQNVRVEDASDFAVSDVHLVGAEGGGVLVRRSHEGEIRDSLVEGTLADGIHMTAGSSRLRVRDNLVRETGDDGIAVVSYLSDGESSRDVTVAGNRVVAGAARGISVVGGERVAIEGNEVVETESGGIYVAAEREWDTYGVREVSVVDNRVVGAPTRNSHASVLVYSSEMLVDDVSFRGNTVLGSTTTAFGSWLHPDDSGEVGDLSYEGNRVADSAASLWAPTRLNAGTIERSGNVGF